MSVQTNSMQAKAATVVLPGVGQSMNILGHQATLKLTSSDTSGDGYLFDLVTPPGLGIPPHVHQIEDEYIYVLEGAFEIFLGGKTYAAHQGALIYFPRTIAHGFRNIGAGAGRTLWTVVPGGNFEKFFAELGALSMEAAPDMQKVVALFNRYGMEVLPPSGLCVYTQGEYLAQRRAGSEKSDSFALDSAPTPLWASKSLLLRVKQTVN